MSSLDLVNYALKILKKKLFNIYIPKGLISLLFVEIKERFVYDSEPDWHILSMLTCLILLTKRK